MAPAMLENLKEHKAASRKQYLLANGVHHSLIVGIVLTIATMTGLLYWAAERQNRSHADFTLKLVNGNLSAMKLRMADTISEVINSPQVLSNLRSNDTEWLNGDLRDKLLNSPVIDLAGIDIGHDQPRALWYVDGEGKTTGTGDDLQLFWDLRRTLTSEVKSLSGIYTDFIEWRGAVFIIGAAYFSQQNLGGALAAATPIFVLGQELNKRSLKYLEEELTLKNLTFAPVRDPGAKLAVIRGTGALIKSSLDQPLAYLHWQPERPGDEFIHRAAIPVLIVFLTLSAVGLCAARFAKRSSSRLLDQEKYAFWLARHDTVTRLPNRESLLDRMTSSTVRSECQAGHAAMMLIDIAGLRDINNAVGQAGGNELIRQVAERLQQTLPPNTYLARTGGDEFDVLVLSNYPDDDIRSCAEMVQNVFSPDYTVSGHIFQVRAAIGYASSHTDKCGITELKRRCDLAVMEAKRVRTGSPLHYNPDLDTILNNHRDLEVPLRQAIADGEITVVYQPIVCSRTRRLLRVEALARWSPAHLGHPVSPEIFISLAEQAGLISALGQSVLIKVCRDMQMWPDLKVSVNASPRELSDPRFVARLIRTCRDHNILPQRLAIELTEGVLVTQPEVSRMRLNALRAAGFRVFLDDFGDGFSSIGYLRRLPFDTLKIDRSFIRDITNSEEAQALIVSITGLAKALHLNVVAEGVETEEQASLLQLTDVESYQGFLFGHPMTFLELLARYGDGVDAENPKEIRPDEPETEALKATGSEGART
ncbi:EAL domain-containing protein [Roseibium sp. CAU 1637]|uniref:EAL domain-containing protein n=1 Tax=Roseibium limicola TaxID=2816037 RepID=A0A939ELJ0_9HYPH|nr:bifunctional diguanylate cyclase/phosphodiesterase [Roseibium limicola]MBO0344652.1 EAL domain-containing protein [Roseibium limicola]